MPESFPYKITEHRVPSSYIREYPHALANSQADTLTLAVKQYTPLNNPAELPAHAITIVAAHANGFPKELYEPLFADILTACQSQSPTLIIRSIWIADIAHQNASSKLNEALLGNDPGWYDHARDLTFLINLKRKEMPRPIFGLGHSVGGNNLVNVSLFNPRLFQGLILLDPVIQIRSAEAPFRWDPAKDPIHKSPWSRSVAGLSTFRRDIWPSRAEAAKTFVKSPFYKTWDPRVLDRWIEFGLCDLPSSIYPDEQPPKVTLATPVAMEVHHFLRPNYDGYGTRTPLNRETHADIDVTSGHTDPFYRPESTRTFHRLPEVRPSVLYIFGSESDVSSDKIDRAKLESTGVGIGGSGGLATGKVKGVTLQGVGHLIAMQACKEAAGECVTWLGAEMARFEREEEAWRKEWRDGKTLREKQVVTEKWKAAMGGDPRARKLKKDKEKEKGGSKL